MGSNYVKGRGDTPIRFGEPAHHVGALLRDDQGGTWRVHLDCTKVRTVDCTPAYLLDDGLLLRVVPQEIVERNYEYAGRFAA